MIKTCAVVLLCVLVGPACIHGQTESTFLGFKNSQQCECECECSDPADKKCLCDCDCPRPGSSCGPGFTQVCPSADGSCPDDYMPLCPEDLTASGRADTPVVQNREAYTITPAAFTCSKKTITCTVALEFEADCSAITKATPTCDNKKSSCSGKTITFAAGDKDMRCLITGTYKNKNKKQTMKSLSIAVNPEYTTTTTTTTTTTLPGPKGDFNCQCVPDFMLYMGQLAMQGAASRQGFMGSCVCVAGMMDIAV